MIAYGLNTSGGQLTQGLNYSSIRFVVQVPFGEIAVAVLVSGLVVVMFVTEERAFRPEVSTAAESAADAAIATQQLVTGLSPQADPPQLFAAGAHVPSAPEPALARPQHEVTGLDPTDDPEFVFAPEESTAVGPAATQEVPQHQVTGLDPQPDPSELFEPEESTAQEDD